MLGRLHALYPQALVIALVVLTMVHFQHQKRARKPQRLGTMLWVFIFAMTLELSYSIALLGRVECPVLIWYVYCSVLGVMALAVLQRDKLIDSMVARMVTSEEALVKVHDQHQRLSRVVLIGCVLLAGLSLVLPALMSPGASVLPLVPFVVFALVIPVALVKLGHNSGLGPALVTILLAFIGNAYAYSMVQKGSFSFPTDSMELFSTLLNGGTTFKFTSASITSILMTGFAVLCCALLFRLPKVVRPEEKPALEASEEPNSEQNILEEVDVATAHTTELAEGKTCSESDTLEEGAVDAASNKDASETSKTTT